MSIEFTCDGRLLDRMKRKKRTNIVVEVATSSTSDFEVSEIFLRLCRDGDVPYLTSKKRYRAVDCGDFKVLLPPYKLEYDEHVRFGQKRVLFLEMMTFEGIRL